MKYFWRSIWCNILQKINSFWQKVACDYSMYKYVFNIFCVCQNIEFIKVMSKVYSELKVIIKTQLLVNCRIYRKQRMIDHCDINDSYFNDSEQSATLGKLLSTVKFLS